MKLWFFSTIKDKIESFADAVINKNVQEGKSYVYSSKSTDGVDIGYEIYNKGEEYIEFASLNEGEIIFVISTSVFDKYYTDYIIQRQNGDVVTIGQMAGRP